MGVNVPSAFCCLGAGTMKEVMANSGALVLVSDVKPIGPIAVRFASSVMGAGVFGAWTGLLTTGSGPACR